MTKAVNGVVEGQELWFSNAGRRETDGNTDNAYPPGQVGAHWLFDATGSDGYYLWFRSAYSAGHLTSRPKSQAFSVRCVR